MPVKMGRIAARCSAGLLALDSGRYRALGRWHYWRCVASGCRRARSGMVMPALAGGNGFIRKLFARAPKEAATSDRRAGGFAMVGQETPGGPQARSRRRCKPSCSEYTGTSGRRERLAGGLCHDPRNFFRSCILRRDFFRFERRSHLDHQHRARIGPRRRGA